MPSLQEIRAQAPEYNDLSDQQFIDAFHKKFYSDIPKEQLYKKIGYSPKQDVPRRTLSESYKLLNQLTNDNRSPLDSLRDFGYGAATGTLNLGNLINEGLTKGVNKVFGSKLQPITERTNWKKDLQKIASPNPSVGGELLKGLGQYTPEAIGVAASGGGAIPLLAGGAASGAANSDENTENLDLFGLIPGGILPQGRGGAAIEGAGLNVIPNGLHILEALRPSKMFRGKLSPEELSRNLNDTKGTSTQLGRVIESPRLSRLYENMFPHIPFSGGYESMQGTGSQVKDIGLKILDDLGISQNKKIRSQDISDQIKEATKLAKKEKNAKYMALNRASEEAGVKVGRDNISYKANSILENLNKNPELTRSIPKEIMDDIKYHAQNKDSTSLETTDKLKGILNSQASKHFREGNDFIYGHYKSLAESLEKDSEEALDSTKDTNVQKLRKEAREYYKNVYQPTREKDILQLTRKNSNPYRALKSYLTKGSDNTQSLDRLQESLSLLQQESLPAQFHLGRSFNKSKQNPGGGFDPRKLGELYSDLSEEQASSLIPDTKLRNRLNSYQNLSKMNEKSLNTMFNPPTGQTGLDYFFKTGFPVSLASTGATIGALHGGPIGGLIGGGLGYLAGLVGPGMVSKPLVKALTNEKTREKLVKAMLENKQKFNSPGKQQALSAALQSMINKGQ